MRNSFLRTLYTGALGLFLAGCGAEGIKTVEMKAEFAYEGEFRSPTLYSFDDGNFYHNGFPTGLRQQPDGKVDLSDFPRPFQLVTQTYVSGIEKYNPTRGYHTISPIYLPLTHPVSINRLPTDPRDYTNPNSSIQVVDIDPQSSEYGRRFPLSVTQTKNADSYRPENLLQIMPTLGISLRPNTTYAAVVTDEVPVGFNYQAEQNVHLSRVLSPEPGSEATAATELFRPLRQFLANGNIDPDIIIAATVWKTGDPTAAMERGAEVVSNMPLSSPTNLELAEDFPDYCAIRGYIKIPGFQKGWVPYLLNGRIDWDSNGVPIQQYTRNAEFIVTIPKDTTMPNQGFPLLEYHHGAGGSTEQVFNRIAQGSNTPGNGPAQIAAERGWSSSGFSGHLGSDHAGPILGFGMVPYNVENPVSMYNSYYQMVWERVYFRRVLNQLRIPRGLCPQGAVANGEDHYKFDSDLRVVMGQSLGNWTASLQMVADPEPYQGAVLTGVAGTWIKLFTNLPEMKFALATVMGGLLPIEELDEMHPFLMLMEWLVGTADPAAYLHKVYRYPSKTAPHVLAVSGINDRGGEEPTQWPHLMALGLDLAGPDVGDNYYNTLMPHLGIGGATQRPYPVSNNLNVPGQGTRTAAVVRYENTVRSDNNGHHVAFDLDPPKHQYGCFLQYLSWQQTPKVFEGSYQGAPCP